MTAWSSPKTWTAATLTVADANQEWRDNLLNIDERLTVSGITSPSALNKIKGAVCGVRCTNTSDPTHTTGTDKTLTWDGESYDSDGFHSTASNTHRITIPAGLDGFYYFWASTAWEANATNDRALWIEDSGGIIQLRSLIASSGGTDRTVHTAAGVLQVAAGNWFAVHVTQDSGATLATYSNLVSSGFGAWRIFAA